MEITISKLCSPVKFSISSSLFCLKGNSKRRNLNRAVSVNCLKETNISLITAKKSRSHAPVVKTTRASLDENQSPTSGAGGERWLLQPVGDGDTRHIGYKVAMPAPFEISSGQVTIGRLPEKADVVIPVATVSGVHATINTNENNLLVTDMNSTNGTFIEDKRLIPGVAAPAFPGTRITFGDTNLAIFRVFKLQDNQESTEKSTT
ncbi:Zeaxanthin epoxidase [Cardamine amara subsp. amara]|uniref:Zeaxanthin epoxidase n=1 Tax=Cardamine amara subsp. amara TaxID=228776 RepID=A0ABD1ANA5_CARAN